MPKTKTSELTGAAMSATARQKLQAAEELLAEFLVDNTEEAFEEIPKVDEARSLIEEAVRQIDAAPDLLEELRKCAVHIAATRGNSDPYAMSAFALIAKTEGGAA